MAVLRFPEEACQVKDEAEIRARLKDLGIDYERWSLDRVPPDSSLSWSWRRMPTRSRR